MPKIGLRTMKTTLAVFLCLLLDVLLAGLFPRFGLTVYSPFFSALAAVYSISDDRNYSFKLAKVRSIGSIIGSIVAILVVFLYEFVVLAAFPLLPSLFRLGIKYSLVSLFLIVLIYSTILFKQTDATFVACLTFLSISVGNRTDLSTTLFALNLTLSTIIGVLIALAVNFAAFRRRRNKDILFLMGVDRVFVDRVEPLPNQSKFLLKELLHEECPLTLATIHTPASLNKIFQGITFSLPHIVMNGAAIYEIETNSFSRIVNISKSVQTQVESILQSNGLNCFTHVVVHDVLTIYYDNLDNQGEITYFENRKNDYFKSFAKGEVPSSVEVVFYVVVALKEKIKHAERQLQELGLESELDIVSYPFIEVEGYYQMKIRNKNATRLLALDAIQNQTNTTHLVAIGNNDFDIPMLQKADYAVCFEDASEQVRSLCDIILTRTQTNHALRLVTKVYFHRKPLQYLAKQKAKKS